MADSGIPYMPQDATAPDRACGAAALAMVYASLGMDRPPKEIWRLLGQPNEQGVRIARTYRLARHVREQGLAALVVQAAHPWAALQRCWEHELRVILNHRVHPHSRTGHFSVLAGIGPNEVLLHDPQLGPARRLDREAFLRLWLPTSGQSEIAGNVLVAIRRPEEDSRRCATCGAPVPASIVCAACGSAIPLEPWGALGCVRAECPARLWKYVFCPECDGVTGEFNG